MPQPLRPNAVLNNKQLKHLRGLGHSLHPVVQLGQKGLTPPLVTKVVEELAHHELIKVKVGQSAVASVPETAAALAAAAGAHLAQVLGRTVLLYRRREKEPDIRLP